MKVTIDVTQLLNDGKISREEHDRLIALSKKETARSAYSAFVVLGIIAVVAGAVGLAPHFFQTLVTTLVKVVGPRGLQVVAIVLSGAGALATGGGFLAIVCAFLTLGFIGNAGFYYTHASYFVAIREPGLTVPLFALLAWSAYQQSLRVDAKRARALVFFSRSCIFIVNLAFWIGSLWGDIRLGISSLSFAVGWALSLGAVGVWATRNDKRWVVNIAIVFGAIHFYTQWFERLGATPGSLLIAGVSALALVYWLRNYNKGNATPRLA